MTKLNKNISEELLAIDCGSHESDQIRSGVINIAYAFLATHDTCAVVITVIALMISGKEELEFETEPLTLRSQKYNRWVCLGGSFPKLRIGYCAPVK